jgi:hypothetical protein
MSFKAFCKAVVMTCRDGWKRWLEEMVGRDCIGRDDWKRWLEEMVGRDGWKRWLEETVEEIEENKEK